MDSFCAVCEVYTNLSVHHIHPKEYKELYPGGPENIDEKANLVILCQGCHAAVHSAKPFTRLVKDLKQKTRRRSKITSPLDTTSVEEAQSIRDRQIQAELWKRLIIVLQNIEYCKKLEHYRKIIKEISYVNSVWVLDIDSNRAA